MRRPIDFDLIRPLAQSDDHKIALSPETDEVLCRHCWAAIIGPGKVRLPEPIQNRVQGFPEWRMGVNRVTIVLADGRSYSPVDVAWATDVVRVQGYDRIPFASSEIVDVFDASDVL